MRLSRRHTGTLGLAVTLALAGLALAAPGRPAGADSETFFASPAPCPVAHCTQHLDGREGLAIPVSVTPTVTTTYTPSTVAFNTGLGCTAGYPASGGTPDIVACSGNLPSNAGSATESFLYDLTASSSTGGHPITSVALTTTWVSAGYTGLPGYPCQNGSGTEFPVDPFVANGVPLLSDLGYVYVSDDHSMVKYNPTADGSGYGTCYWGSKNPDRTAMISWNAVALPANPPDGSGYQGGTYLVGQGHAGPVVVVNTPSATPTITLTLPDAGSGEYATYNTISVVKTSTGARLYDSTADCPAYTCTDNLAQAPGRLYALDLTAPTTAGGVPTMAVAWSYPFEGPSGASPMVLAAQDRSGSNPVGDQIYVDGSGGQCSSSPCTQPEHPTLFGLRDRCPFDSTSCASGSYSPTQIMDVDFTSAGYPATEHGYCPLNSTDAGTYDGIQAAPVLENPEGGTGDYSVWVHVACGPALYRFDAQSGATWGGSGAITITIPNFPGLDGYVPGSTMQTVTDSNDSNSGDTVAFLGVNQSPATNDSYVTALDLETGSLLWKVEGPTTVLHADDTPFHGQFPIAETSCGSGCTGYVLIAPTSGTKDGATILGLVLK